MSETPRRVRVLLTNDDGPPGKESPYIFAFSQHLKNELGWDVKVVVPSSQKSWIGKAFHIKEITHGQYYYPKMPNGDGERSSVSRPLREGEVDEWILLDATPATCVNIALFNLFPGQFDLVLAGPNLGRNSSSAFALSSGTIGAALSGALSGVKAIAVSYGTVLHPTPMTLHQPAHRLSGSILQRLWSSWGSPLEFDAKQVDLYNVNIPMIPELATPGSLPVYWTRMWRNSYSRLFKPANASVNVLEPAGPDSDDRAISAQPSAAEDRSLIFKFSPAFESLINPDPSIVPEGTDAWALLQGGASVTPLLASYAEPVDVVGLRKPGDQENPSFREPRRWKL